MQALTAGAGSYAAAEAASAASITSPLLDAINAPFLAALDGYLGQDDWKAGS